MNVRP